LLKDLVYKLFTFFLHVVAVSATGHNLYLADGEGKVSRPLFFSQ